MSDTFQTIVELVNRGQVRISVHGYDELADDDIFVSDVVDGVADGTVIEDYPDYPKGPCCLVLQKDTVGEPLHLVWGIPKGSDSPAVLVTAYRPDPDKWSDDFMRRLK